MQITHQSPTFAVIDDLLDDDDRSELWTYFQFANLAPVTRTQGAWRLEDGIPLGGDMVITPERDEPLHEAGEKPGVFPSGTALDLLMAEVLGLSQELEPWIGDDWAKLMTRAYVYPRGAGLSWHGDEHQIYQGAFIYYAHPEWNIEWGGELLISDPPAVFEDSPEAAPIMGHRFDNHDYSAMLMNPGMGSFIMPRPNRLVVLGSAPHRVMPVAAAAGQNIRASVQGFFLRPED